VTRAAGSALPRPDGDTATVTDVPPDHVIPADHDAPPGPAAAAPVVSGPEPTDAERARTLAATITTGVLSTLAREPAGTPFGSVAPFGLDAAARPVLCISALAEHTQNLRRDPRGSLLVAQPVAAGADPMAGARLTLLGRLDEVPDADVPAARAAHLAGNPHAALYVDYGDFSFWRLDVESVRYVGGYGRMSWVTTDQWRDAEPDPVAPVAAGAVEHLNADHADACLLIAQRLGGRPDAAEVVVTSLDRYGLDLVATGSAGTGRVRVSFPEPLGDGGAVRAAAVELVRRARQA
jgi:putative heme iron utilization protein